MKVGTGVLTLSGNNTYTGGTFFNAGTVSVAADNNLGAANGALTFNGGTLQFTNGGAITLSATRAVTLHGGGGTFDLQGTDVTINQAISGGGGLTVTGASGRLLLNGTNSYGGATMINNAGVLSVGGGNATPDTSTVILNDIAVFELRASETIRSLVSASSTTQVTGGPLANIVLTTGDNESTTFAGVISNCVCSFTTALTKVGTGTFTLSGANTYTGDTNVNTGTLQVNGSIVSPSFVNNSGALAGIGTVGNVTVNNGGAFAPGSGVPGSTMTAAGSLAFASGALYLVQINAAGLASRANVGTTATLTGGTVNVNAAPGSYTVGQSYTILTATGGLGGTTFSGLNITGPARGHLAYDPNNVFLIIDPSTLALPPGLSGNQQAVGNAINAFVNNGGTLPPAFQNLLNLTGGNLANALTLLSGEAATGGQQGAFQLMSQFLGIMLDPFVEGRSGIGAGPATGFAPEREALPQDIALAYASLMKAPVKKATVFEQRWSVWGGAYSGYNRTSGDPVASGSHDLTSRAGGFALGLDYRAAPDTVVGFSLAGGGTNWSFAQGLGSGKSDAFQAGVYGTTRSGPAYVAAALAYAWHGVSTDRFAFAGNHLTADFNAQSIGGRVEGGYRMATPVGAMTPYAALQAQSFRTPSYAETDLNAGGFALAYNARSGTATRSELGARFEHVVALDQKAALTLRGRVAWAHDWVSNPSMVAGFQTLPGMSFIVDGATPAKDSALVSAGAELRLAGGVTLAARFDGEFAGRSFTYAGTGTVRYAW